MLQHSRNRDGTETWEVINRATFVENAPTKDYSILIDGIETDGLPRGFHTNKHTYRVERTESDEASLISSGYEWVCPECEAFHKSLSITELVECDDCKGTFETNHDNRSTQHATP